MKADGKDFFSKGALKMILEQLGWTMFNPDELINNMKEFGGYEELPIDLIPIRPDFYIQGTKLASSDIYDIICDGESEIIYKEEKFSSPSIIYNRYGLLGIKDIANWKFTIEKEWAIKLNVRSGKGWTDYSFTHLNDCPFRTTVRN